MLQGYTKLTNGVIKQIDPKPFQYDEDYVTQRYDSYDVLCDMMSHLRYGYIRGVLGQDIKSILDVGYGNGSFLKICSNAGLDTYGTDVSHYPLKYGKFIDFNDCLISDHKTNVPFDVITFFDSIEHFNYLTFLKKLKCKYICVSVPFCHYNEFKNTDEADEYFKNWKHRRENEHIWHFDKDSLVMLMSYYGYELMASSTIEDIIRKPVDGMPNILTCVFKNIG